MARLWLFTCVLFLSFAVNYNQILVPHSGRIAGVFNPPGFYDASQAEAVCPPLNATQATKAQMEAAVQQGLETCTYGWIEGQIAAIPRITSVGSCGKGNLGVVIWRADKSRKFSTFCFQAPDLVKHVTTPSETPMTLKSITTLPMVQPRSMRTVTPTIRMKQHGLNFTRTPTRTPRRPPRPSTASAAPRDKTTQASVSGSVSGSASTPLASPSASTSSAPPSASGHPFAPTAFPWDPVTTPSPVAPLHQVVTTHTVPLHSGRSALSSIGAIPTALIVLVLVLCLLTAAAVWYYKVKRRVLLYRPRGQKKDDPETEMWKHAESEMDCESQQGGEEGADGKLASEAPLGANPDS